MSKKKKKKKKILVFWVLIVLLFLSIFFFFKETNVDHDTQTNKKLINFLFYFTIESRCLFSSKAAPSPSLLSLPLPLPPPFFLSSSSPTPPLTPFSFLSCRNVPSVSFSFSLLLSFSFSLDKFHVISQGKRKTKKNGIEKGNKNQKMSFFYTPHPISN